MPTHLTRKEVQTLAGMVRGYRRGVRKITQRQAAGEAQMPMPTYIAAERGVSIGFKTRQRLLAWMQKQ